MGINNIIIDGLKALLTSSKEIVESNEGIENLLRNDNIAPTVELDTSITAIQAINLNALVEGGKIHSVTVLDVGGGLYLQTSIGEPFQVYYGDSIENEDIETLRWKGGGAGTAVLRLTGVRL